MEKLSVIDKFISLSCKSEASKEAYRNRIKLFCNIFNTNLEDIVNQWYEAKYDLVKREKFLDKWNSTLDDYKVYLRNKGYAELTINQALAIAKSFFKWNRIPIGIIQYERPIVRFHNRDIKPEELITILEHSNLRDRAFYLVMKDSGLRPHTICLLKYKNIKEDFEANRIPMLIKTPSFFYEVVNMRKQDVKNIRNWRRRGHYSETRLDKILQKHGYNALRIPLSNPSMNPLPDVLARREQDTHAFEVKNANYMATIPRHQILKLFEFLEQYITTDRSLKHVVLACHLGRIWKFKELPWRLYDNDTIPETLKVSRKSRSNWKYDQ